jgi:hypothetical protein
LDSNRQEPSETKNDSSGGRTATNDLTINWQLRAQAIWELHPSLKRDIVELHSIAYDLSSRTIGGYEDFRRKFNGTRAASEAHARILFQAGQFDQAGITFSEWMSSDEEWSDTAGTLAPVDTIGFLTKEAAKGGMAVTAMSTPTRIPPGWRRLRDGDPAGNELHVGEYLQLTVTFPDSSDVRPVYLLALEWSANSRDWQIFNFVRTSLIAIDKPEPVIIRGGDTVAQIPAGVTISGQKEAFDLFVLGQRTPFDHKARSYLDNLGRRATISVLEMSRLIQLLFDGAGTPDVAVTTYEVVD